METSNLQIIRSNGIDCLCRKMYVAVNNPSLTFTCDDNKIKVIPVDPAYWDKIYEYRGLKVYLRPQIYANGWLALYLEPVAVKQDFIVLTKNLEDMNAQGLPDHAYVDINNESEALKFLEENGLAINTGYTRRSGWVEYPMVKLNLPLIYQHNPTVFDTINL